MYINLIQDKYESLSISVKDLYGLTEDFNIEVGVHQWLGLG